MPVFDVFLGPSHAPHYLKRNYVSKEKELLLNKGRHGLLGRILPRAGKLGATAEDEPVRGKRINGAPHCAPYVEDIGTLLARNATDLGRKSALPRA